MDKDTEKTSPEVKPEPKTRLTKEMLQRKEALITARTVIENRTSSGIASGSKTVNTDDLLRVTNYIIRGFIGTNTGKTS